MCACALPLAAQERRATSGRVLDRQRRPWTGASVTLVSNPFPGLVDGSDVVTAQSDEGGRFKVELLEGRHYSAWAVQALEAARYRATGYAEDLVAGAAIELFESGTYAGATLAFRGLAAWRDAAPFTVELGNAAGHQRVTVAALAGDGEVAAAPIGAGRTFVRLRDKDGRLLDERIVHATLETGLRRQVSSMTVDVPPPLPVLLRVRGPGGEAIAGATISRLGERSLELLATTGDDGCFLGDLPLRATKLRETFQVYQRLLVEAKGFGALVLPGFKHPGERDRPALRQQGGADVELKLVPATAIRGRLLGPDGKPAAFAKLLLHATLDTATRQVQHPQHPLVFAADADGRFEVMGPVAERAWQLLALPSTELMAGLPRPPRHPLVAFAVLAQGVAAAPAVLDLGEVRLDRLAALDVEVRAASGEPALYADVVLGLSGQDRTGRSSLRHGLPVPADHRGRFRLLAGPTTRLALAARSLGGVVQVDFDATAVQGKNAPLVLTLSPTVCVRGRALKPGDEPLAGARILAQQSASLPREVPALLASLPRSFETTTHDDGSFEIRVAANGRVRLTAQGRDDSLVPGSTFHGSDQLQVRDQDVECTIRTAPAVMRG